MFGAYRTALALFVVLSHLGGIPGFGGYAVFGFYTLSGYLMTLILHSGYGWSWPGRARYALNRLLRIAPPYWAACLLSIALIAWLGPDRTAGFRDALFLPPDAASWLRNIGIVLFHDPMPRLVPPAWALTVELCFYLVIGLGASRNRAATAVWFVASVAYTVVVNARPHDLDATYYSIPAASLPFSTGAMIFHFKEPLLKAFGWLNWRLVPALLFCAVLANLRLAHQLGSLHGFSFYVNHALNSLLVLTLASRTELPGISRRADAFLGDFSYPIYLVHWQAGLLLAGAGFTAAQRGEPLFALAALPPVLLLAWLLTVCVERPVERWRRKVKGESG